ncbi:MAG TPA: GntR family transcriptional regulator [Virgibacillus sp.]|nr:GntR family transcriptional regulator [Virgibacillus sp.]
MKNENKTQKAYRIIKLRIIERVYAPGQRLIIDQLARELKTSSIPVREAIRQLEAEKLVSYQKNIGPVVSSVNESDYSDTLRVLAVLEGYATALSAEDFPAENLIELKKLNRQMKDALQSFDIILFGKLNLFFHRKIFEACGNEFLIEEINGVLTRLDSIRGVGSTLYSVRVQESINEHEHMIYALENKLVTGIEELARTHKLRTVENFEKRRMQQFDIKRLEPHNGME